MKHKHEFDAEAHFDTHMKNNTVRDQGVVIDFHRELLPKQRSTNDPRIPRTGRTKYSYAAMLPLVELHQQYITKLKGNLPPDDFLPILLGAEMAGAEITIGNRQGIIAENRKNSLIVVFKNGATRCFPRASWGFVFRHAGFDYVFYSRVKCNHRLRSVGI